MFDVKAWLYGIWYSFEGFGLEFKTLLSDYERHRFKRFLLKCLLVENEMQLDETVG